MNDIILIAMTMPIAPYCFPKIIANGIYNIRPNRDTTT